MSYIMDIMEKRRSIRKFKSDQVSLAQVTELLKAAQLAPSGCNAQPWRFKIVTDQVIKEKLVAAAKNQRFLAQAPLVLVCCADIQGYIDGTISGIQDLFDTSAVEENIASILKNRAQQLTIENVEYIYPRVESNVAIAIEHIVLRAVELGLGSCWVRLFDEAMVKEVFGWNDLLHVVALLPLGYPAENPAARKRLALEQLVLD